MFTPGPHLTKLRPCCEADLLFKYPWPGICSGRKLMSRLLENINIEKKAAAVMDLDLNVLMRSPPL